MMDDNREVLENCSICGRDLYEGEAAYATTTGTIQEDMSGFCQDESPWLTVACEDCGESISTIINNLTTAKLLEAFLATNTVGVYDRRLSLEELKRIEEKGLHRYEIRHNDYGDPATVERAVRCNYWGTIVTEKPMPCMGAEDDFIELTTEDDRGLIYEQLSRTQTEGGEI